MTSFIRCAHQAVVPIEELKLQFNPKNRNVHSQEQIERLSQILKYQGARYCAKISKQSGFITSGHGRILAAEKSGWTEYPVDYQDYEDEAQEYADLTADNAIAAWAEIDLSGVNADIGDLGPDFNIDLLGIKNFKVEVADKLPPGCDEDEVPQKVEPKTVLGDIYLLGGHRLMCGDSTSIDAVEKLMNGEKAEITFTSPPYNAGKPFTNRNKKNLKESFYHNYDDNLSSDDYRIFLSSLLNCAIIVSNYVFINLQFLNSNKNSISEWLSCHRCNLVDIACAVKSNPVPSFHPGQMNCGFELIFIFSRNSDTRSIESFQFSNGTRSNVFEYKKDTEKDLTGIHDARFPVSFAEQFISNFSKSTVLDPFGGSGSTLIACEKTDRRCFMMEIDPHYCDVIVARWEKYTGKQAELIQSGI